MARLQDTYRMHSQALTAISMVIDDLVRLADDRLLDEGSVFLA